MMDPREESSEVILNTKRADNTDPVDPEDDDQQSTSDTMSEVGSIDDRDDDASHHSVVYKEITSTLRDVVLELGNLKQQIEQVKSVGQESVKKSSCTNNSVKTDDQSANAANIDFQSISGQYTGTPFSGGQPTCYRVSRAQVRDHTGVTEYQRTGIPHTDKRTAVRDLIEHCKDIPGRLVVKLETTQPEMLRLGVHPYKFPLFQVARTGQLGLPNSRSSRTVSGGQRRKCLTSCCQE